MTTQYLLNKKNALFKHIVNLYDYMTGSSLSPILYYSEEDTSLYVWQYVGESYAARNIITNKLPKDGGFTENEDVSVEGIYYIDSNADFDLYIGEKKEL